MKAKLFMTSKYYLNLHYLEPDIRLKLLPNKEQYYQLGNNYSVYPYSQGWKTSEALGMIE